MVGMGVTFTPYMGTWLGRLSVSNSLLVSSLTKGEQLFQHYSGDARLWWTSLLRCTTTASFMMASLTTESLHVHNTIVYEYLQYYTVKYTRIQTCTVHSLHAHHQLFGKLYMYMQ